MKEFWNRNQVAIEVLGTIAITVGGLAFMYYAGRKAGLKKGLNTALGLIDSIIPEANIAERLVELGYIHEVV